MESYDAIMSIGLAVRPKKHVISCLLVFQNGETEPQSASSAGHFEPNQQKYSEFGSQLKPSRSVENVNVSWLE